MLINLHATEEFAQDGLAAGGFWGEFLGLFGAAGSGLCAANCCRGGSQAETAAVCFLFLRLAAGCTETVAGSALRETLERAVAPKVAPSP